MSKLLQKLLFLLLFSQSAMLSAQISNCAPLAPPSWIVISNISPTTASASWEGVAPGAWYEVELYNNDLNYTEDLIVTQSLYRDYTSLSPGTSYTVNIRAGTCPGAPWGTTNSKEFSTPIIIIDDIAGLQDTGDPDNQPDYSTPDYQVTMSSFGFCLPKTNGEGKEFKKNDVLHAFVKPQPGSNDYMEFTLAADFDDQVHFPTSYQTGVDDNLWDVDFISSNLGGQGTNNEYVTIRISYRFTPPHYTQVLEISVVDLFVSPDYLPVSFLVSNGAEFYVSQNNCILNGGVCGFPTGAAGKPAETTAATPSPKDIDTPLLRVAPNPFRDQLNLEINTAQQDVINIRIVDATGRLQYETGSEGTKSETRNIETSTWQPGMYFLQVQTKSGVKVEPIVKLK